MGQHTGDVEARRRGRGRHCSRPWTLGEPYLSAAKARRGLRCRASLIEPDGGRLVDLVAPEEGGRRAALRRRCRTGCAWAGWTRSGCTCSAKGGRAPSAASCARPSSSKHFISTPSAARMAGWSTCPSPSCSPSVTPSAVHPGRVRRSPLPLSRFFPCHAALSLRFFIHYSVPYMHCQTEVDRLEFVGI
jgi:hypothetical protein